MVTIGMADHGEESAGEVLPPDPDRQEATRDGVGYLGSLVLGNRVCPWPGYGGVLMISELLTRLCFLIFRKRRSELDEEIEFHLEQAITTRIAAGMDPAEARRQ